MFNNLEIHRSFDDQLTGTLTVENVPGVQTKVKLSNIQCRKIIAPALYQARLSYDASNSFRLGDDIEEKQEALS